MVKKLLYTLLFTICGMGIQAQSQTALDRGMRLLEQKAASWQLAVDDYKGAMVSDMYTDKTTGNTYIYFQQAIDGIPVSNAITPVVISKNGNAVNVASRFIPNAKSKIANISTALNPADAISAAANALGVQAGKITSQARSVINGVHTFENVSFAHNEVKVRKEYTLVGEKLIPVWDLSIDVKGSADYWNTKINVADGSLVDKHNYTVYCQHKHDKYAKHHKCEATSRVEKKDAVSFESANAAVMMGASYNAFAFPTESPVHGERVIITDGVYPDASPFGWHDTDGMDGAEYNITRGNNAWAFLDREGTDFSNEDEPDGGLDLIFDYPYNLDSEADDNADASVTNLFTAVNQVHDIMYRLGFDEPAGNFQQNTLGNGGSGGDPVLAQAFDGIDLPEPNVNNANFSTPADGGSGRMQMFLWENSGGVLSIDSPANISGFITQVGTAVAQFGGTIPTINQQPISGKVVIAVDDDAGSPNQVCNPIANVNEVAGNIALIDRGLCNFSLKAFHAQQAGAITCLICNVPGADGPGSSGENVLNMAAGDRADEVTITPIFLPKSACDRMRLEINNGNEVTMTLQERDPIGPAHRDAAFDNGVIAHEYGHGISNRLIGGPGQSGCLGSAEQMGEGISDFVALLLTVEEGDTREDARGIGNYVDFLAPAAGGIRTYPYTTDFTINPRTYEELPGFLDDNGDPLIYSVGEVWTIALWEMYWNIVDKKGLDVTWTDEEAGNFIAGKLFVQGMKIAPCNPTLIEMRDAIVAADEICYGSAHELEIWTAFAKRGLGFGATGGSSNDITDGTTSFEIFPLAIKTLKVKKEAQTLVNAGDEVEITLTANNHIPEEKTGVFINDQLPEGASFVVGSESMPVTVDGSMLTFNLGTMAYEDEVVITYRILIDESLESTTLFLDNVDDTNSGSYDIQLIEGFSIWNISTDDANSGESSLYVRESATEENDQTIQINGIEVAGDRPVLRFWHKYETENIFDGGFIRISEDGGNVFKLMNGKFLRNDYVADLDYNTFAIPSLRGFSGSSKDEWLDSYVDLSEYAGKTISVQFRFGSNDMNAADVPNPGWFVDDVEIFDLTSFSSVACINSDTGTDEVCSNMLDFIINSNGSVGTKNDLKFEHLSIGMAPNPADDYVTVSINSDRNESLQLDLTSVEGKLISSQRVFNSSSAVRTFDVSALNSGIYFLTVKSENEVVTTEKIVIK